MNVIAHYKMNENTASDNDELVTNGVFAAWTTPGTPDDWSVVGESGNDPEIDEAATGEQHSDTPTLGGGSCNIYTSSAAIMLRQDIGMVTGKRYSATVVTSFFSGNALIFRNSDGIGNTIFTIVAAGTQTASFVAVGPYINLRRDGACNATIDSITVKLCAAEDSSGNDHDGLAQQDTDAISAANTRGVGTCFDFDGSADYIEIADHADFTPALTPFSISAWVYMHDATNFTIASKGVEGTDGEWKFYTDASDKLLIHFYDESINKYIGRKYNTALSENTWLYVVATYDGGILSTRLGIYLNGVKVDDTTDEAATFIAVENLDHVVWIGYDGTNFANGLIDNVIIFNTELNEDEIKALYHGGHGTEIVEVIDLDRRIKRRQ